MSDIDRTLVFNHQQLKRGPCLGLEFVSDECHCLSRHEYIMLPVIQEGILTRQVTEIIQRNATVSVAILPEVFLQLIRQNHPQPAAEGTGMLVFKFTDLAGDNNQNLLDEIVAVR